MTKTKIIRTLTVAVILGILSQLFIPRTYNISPPKERKGVQYWELETGSRIGYTKINNASDKQKNPIIYLHGGPGGKITDEIIKAFRPLSKLGHELYFYDQIGSGQSARLENIAEYSVERHRRDLQEIVAKTGFKKVILVGHSWGALLAVNYLEDNHESVERLILTGPGPILPVNKSAANEKAPDSLSLKLPEYSNSIGNKKVNNWRSNFIQKWAYIFNKKLATDQEVDAFFTLLNQELVKSTDCQWNQNKEYKAGCGYYSHIMTLKSFREVKNRREELKQLKLPVLILRGQCDNQKWGFANEYLEIFSNSELKIITDAGHNLIGGSPKQHFDLIKEFLGERTE